jgi:hypothetical protein
VVQLGAEIVDVRWGVGSRHDSAKETSVENHACIHNEDYLIFENKYKCIPSSSSM